MRDRHSAGYGLRRPGADGVHERLLRFSDAGAFGFGRIVLWGARHEVEVGSQILTLQRVQLGAERDQIGIVGRIRYPRPMSICRVLTGWEHILRPTPAGISNGRQLGGVARSGDRCGDGPVQAGFCCKQDGL